MILNVRQNNFRLPMAKRTITVMAPFIIPQPGEKPKDYPDDTASLHVGHNGESYVFYWVYRSDCPRYIRPATGEVRRLVTTFTGETRSNKKHGKVILVFEDFLEDIAGGSVAPEWDWAEWLPYCPDRPSNGTLQSLPPGIALPPGYE